jgi:hypothetical protein
VLDLGTDGSEEQLAALVENGYVGSAGVVLDTTGSIISNYMFNRSLIIVNSDIPYKPSLSPKPNFNFSPNSRTKT